MNNENSFSSVTESTIQTPHTEEPTSSLPFISHLSTSSVLATQTMTGTTSITPTRIPLQTTEQCVTLSTPVPSVTQTTHTEHATTEGGSAVHSDKVTEPTKG